jgi:hypothetical protein
MRAISIRNIVARAVCDILCDVYLKIIRSCAIIIHSLILFLYLKFSSECVACWLGQLQVQFTL